MRLLVTLGFIGLGIYAYKKHKDALREAKMREAWLAQQQRDLEQNQIDKQLYGWFWDDYVY